MKIGVIGCGYVFDHYMTTLPLHPNLDIVGVVLQVANLTQKVGISIRVVRCATVFAVPAIDEFLQFISHVEHCLMLRAELLADFSKRGPECLRGYAAVGEQLLGDKVDQFLVDRKRVEFHGEPSARGPVLRSAHQPT